MVKDLRTRPVSLKVGKCQQLTPEEEAHWGMYQTQTFLPSLESLFKTEILQNAASYGIKVFDPLQKVLTATTIQTSSGKQIEIHRKTTSILNPYRWMRGDYGSIGLPSPQENAGDLQEKLQTPNTAAYVGALASIALSESECPNFPKVYGVFCGMARSHPVDISDDYEELTQRPWFPQNIGRTFEISIRQSIATAGFQHTRGQRPVLETSDDVELDGVAEIEAGFATAEAASISEEDASPAEDSDEEDDDEESTTSTDDLYAIESCDCSSQGSYCEDEIGDDIEPFAWAELSNVPVVTTVMEKCTGTLYQLLNADKDSSHHMAYIAQTIFALAFAQRTFGLVHNDLHGNNVMYVPTEETHINYALDGVMYRVPTHGHLIKIIDFDRATYSIRLQGMREPRSFMSDQFKQDEEAGGQYNVEPFYNPKFPEVKPNPSFDLVRLATSLFWELFPEGPNGESDHPLKTVLLRWLTLPDKTSILFGKVNPKHDRYHGFEQYKAIARYCKDTAVPRKETFITMFKVDRFPLGEKAVIIEP